MVVDVTYEGLEKNRLAVWQNAGSETSAVISYACTVIRMPGRPLSDDMTPGSQDKELQYYLSGTKKVQTYDGLIRDASRSLSQGKTNRQERIAAFYHFCSTDITGITVPGSYDAITCLTNRAGDCGGKSRLMVALCRSAGIPARTVGGLILSGGSKKTTHVWVEVLQGLRWVPYCPLNHHYGSVPDNYMILYRGDYPLLRFKYINLVDYSYTIKAETNSSNSRQSVLARIFSYFSLSRLPTGKQWIIRLLLLIPLGALVVCIMRNLVGIPTIGTFAPVLIALGIHMVPLKWGILLLVLFLTLGLVMRWLMDSMKLLLVPRLSVILTIVVCGTIVFIILTEAVETQLGAFFGLLPVVILTMAIERCWLLELEDGFVNMIKYLMGTITVMAFIYSVFRIDILVDTLFHMPELVCILIALMLLIGRYTGFRLTEYIRFRALVDNA
jgi:hypothetical protein